MAQQTMVMDIMPHGGLLPIWICHWTMIQMNNNESTGIRLKLQEIENQMRIWGFLMERYCGKLLPTIKSGRFPYSNLSNHISDTALVCSLESIYSLDLSFKHCQPLVKKTFSTPECESLQCDGWMVWQLTDVVRQIQKVSCLPHTRITNVSTPLANKVSVSLATWYGITVAIAQKYPTQLSQWGKVAQLEGGDMIHTWDLVHLSEKDHDASYIHMSWVLCDAP